MKVGESLEKVKFWREPDLDNLEFLRATYLTHCFTRHSHLEYAIGVIEHGTEQFEYRRQTHIAPTGSLVVINPAEVHTGQAATGAGWSYRMLYPDPTLLQQAASQLAGRSMDIPFFTSPVIEDAELAGSLLDFHRALETPLTTLERDSRLLWLLSRLIIRHADYRLLPAPPASAPQPVNRVREFLAANLAQNVSLSQLSLIANLSPYHLLRVFQRHLGLPPHAYQTQLRIDRARVLLAQAYPLSQVAHETGFTDQSHLTRHFKRTVGVTPGQYRASQPQ